MDRSGLTRIKRHAMRLRKRCQLCIEVLLPPPRLCGRATELLAVDVAMMRAVLGIRAVFLFGGYAAASSRDLRQAWWRLDQFEA